MADLLNVRLQGPEALVFHALCFCATTVAYDDRLSLVVDEMRSTLPRCPRRDATEQLRHAAMSVCDAFPRRNQPAGAADWALASMKADAAARAFHWAAFCAASGA